MENFDSFGLPEALQLSLKNMRFDKPTPIQAETIPVALKGADVLGSAQTGTGKTGAYGIPLVNRLLSDKACKALVMAPTRELAAQILTALQQMLGKKSDIKSALLIGGDSMFKQLNQLRGKPRLIVGTPGRINDHLKRNSLSLKDAKFLVLDETDRMLDMGFGIQLDKIVTYLPQVRQTLMFSATLPNNIVRLSQKYLNEPVRISIGSATAPAAKVKQENIKLTESEKYKVLVQQLKQNQGSFIIFVNTKRGTDKLATKLVQDGFSADCIHGDLRQRTRERIIKAYRQGKYKILVATDVAARGLDIPHIEFVVNHDLPQCAEDYIHRIGRTGRAEAEGVAINLITPQDASKWKAIQRLMDPDAKIESSGYSSQQRKGGRSGGPKRDRDRRNFREGNRSKGREKPRFEKERFEKEESSFDSSSRPSRSDDKKRKPARRTGFGGGNGDFKNKSNSFEPRGDRRSRGNDRFESRGDRRSKGNDSFESRGDRRSKGNDSFESRGERRSKGNDNSRFNSERKEGRFDKKKSARPFGFKAKNKFRSSGNSDQKRSDTSGGRSILKLKRFA